MSYTIETLNGIKIFTTNTNHVVADLPGVAGDAVNKNFNVLKDRTAKYNMAFGGSPDANLDSDDGYAKGSILYNGTSVFLCTDATVGAAHWINVTATSAVTSVNGANGVVVLTTDNIAEGSSHLYFTGARVLTAIHGNTIEPSTIGGGGIGSLSVVYADVTLTTDLYHLYVGIMGGLVKELSFADDDAVWFSHDPVLQTTNIDAGFGDVQIGSLNQTNTVKIVPPVILNSEITLTSDATGIAYTYAGSPPAYDHNFGGATISNISDLTADVIHNATLIEFQGEVQGTLSATNSSMQLLFDAGYITGLSSPTNPTDAANKAYVDTVAQGLDAKASVKAATTANITLSGNQTIDGVAITAGMRVLVKNQSTAANNGIYVSSASTWTRATDQDAWSEVPGSFTFVEEGTANGNTGWTCTADQGGTLGTTAVPWTQFSSAGAYTAGTGLTLTGTSFAVSDAELLALAGLTSAADKIPYFTGSGTAAMITSTSYGRSLLTPIDAAAARTLLSLGDMAQQSAGDYMPLSGGEFFGDVIFDTQTTFNGDTYFSGSTGGTISSSTAGILIDFDTPYIQTSALYVIGSMYLDGTIRQASSTGMSFGVTGEMIGFLGATPIVRPAATVDLRAALINLGLYTTGGATPLDLNGGTLTSPTVKAPTTLTLQGGSSYASANTNITAGGDTYTNTSGTSTIFKISPTYNQSSGTAVNTDLLVNRTQTAVGSGTQRLLDLQVGGTTKFNVDNSGNVTSAGNVTINGSQLSIGSFIFNGSTIHCSTTTMYVSYRTFSSAASPAVSLGATMTNTSGNASPHEATVTYNQASGSGTNTDFKINRTETALSSGSQWLFDCQVGGTSMFNISNKGKPTFSATNTAPGTTGAQTINKPSGKVNIAAAGTSVVVTNSLVTTTSIIIPVLLTNDSTATIKNVVPASGSFTITLNAAATAEVAIGFLVLN